MQKTRKTYVEYVNTVVKTCSHKWLIMDSRGFRQYRLDKYLELPVKLPPGKLIKVIPARCKSYSCPICGTKKVFDLLDRLKGVNLKKYRFFTLTMKSSGNLDNTELQLEKAVKCFNKLNNKLRKDKRFAGLEYFRVMEIGKETGMVHIHGLWNKFITVKELSAIWQKITGDSYRVNLQKIESVGNRNDVVNYLKKYLVKNVAAFNNQLDNTFFNLDKRNTAAIFYENKKRRYQSSRNFFSKAVKIASEFLPYYVEKHEPREVDKVISQLIRDYGLKKENFDFSLYSFECFTDYLFNTS